MQKKSAYRLRVLREPLTDPSYDPKLSKKSPVINQKKTQVYFDHMEATAQIRSQFTKPTTVPQRIKKFKDRLTAGEDDKSFDFRGTIANEPWKAYDGLQPPLDKRPDDAKDPPRKSYVDRANSVFTSV